MKTLVVDLDGTITQANTSDYSKVLPNEELINQLKSYQKLGYYIVIHTARNMRSYENRIGKINVNTLPIIMKWLNEHGVPYNEIIVGKPWCGEEGFYIDDRAIRPAEFINKTEAEIKKLLG
jgi:capsule biosynthesis phosphatase